MWKRSFRDFAQKWKWKIWKRSFRARLPSKNQTLTCEHQAWTGSSTARPIRAWSAPSRTCSATFARQTPIYLPRYILSCKTQHSVHPLSLKNAFYARLPLKSASWRCESEAFVRDLPSITASFRARLSSNLKVEDMKTKLSCETSHKIWKLKMCKWSFLVRHPQKTWKLKMWKPSFRARFPQKLKSSRCENEAFVRDLPQKLKVENVKMKLSWFRSKSESGR